MGQAMPIRKAVLSSFETAPTPLKPVLPFTNPVHDRLRLEITRGCTRGCRFCQAGILYRPVRERSMEKLLSIADTADFGIVRMIASDSAKMSAVTNGISANEARAFAAPVRSKAVCGTNSGTW